MNDQSQPQTLVLIGGPEVGKSNFLFKLWTGIDSGRGVIRKKGLPKEAEYLQTGAETQLSGRFAGHTSQDVHTMSDIPVVHRDEPLRAAHLIVPDFDGEQINKIYLQRWWPSSWEHLITPVTSYLMFVRANSPQTVSALDWITCHAIYGGSIPLTNTDAATSDVDPTESSSAKPDSDGTKAAAHRTPTQVVLVDWLQFIRQAVTDIVGSSARPKLGIVVTAWDSVPPDFRNGSPAEWVAENLPLLHQFIVTNPRAFEFEFFGTSVFSGDPLNDEDFAEDLKTKDPRTVGYVRHNLGGQLEEIHDFTIPAAWALGWYPID